MTFFVFLSSQILSRVDTLTSKSIVLTPTRPCHPPTQRLTPNCHRLMPVLVAFKPEASDELKAAIDRCTCF